MADHRPYDELGRPPSDPIAFQCVKVFRGSRGTVRCYDPETGEQNDFDNVLLGVRTNSCQFAYWRVPNRHRVESTMGYVEICRVLDRYPPHHEEDSDENDEIDENDGVGTAIFRMTKRLVAVKVIHDERMNRLCDRHDENPRQEISAKQLLGEDPEHVLGAIEVLFDGQKHNVVMRYCDFGDLWKRVYEEPNISNRPTPGLTEAESRFWFRQVMDGVAFLHDRGICHRDLSPENTMIDETEAVIIDMGLCLRVPYLDRNPENPDRTDIRNGTTRCLFNPQGQHRKLRNMSPEIYANQEPFDGAAADVWSCGTILFNMITRGVPYRTPQNLDLGFVAMTQNLQQRLVRFGVEMSEEGIDLLQGMLKFEPSDRLTIEEVRSHPWFDLPDE